MLSEVLVMMIIAGIVFASVMDGMALFNRLAAQKTLRITENIRLVDSLMAVPPPNPPIHETIEQQLLDLEKPYLYEARK